VKTKNNKTALIGTLVLVALSLPIASMAAQKFMVKDSGGTTNKFVITDDGTGISAPDSGYLGIGIAAPLGPIHVVSQGTTLASGGFTVQHTDATAAGVTHNIALAPNFSLYRNNDASAVPSTLPLDGDSLGYFSFGSIINSALTNRAIMFAKAEGVWSSTDNPTFYQFMTNPGLGSGNREIIRLSGKTAVATVNGGLRLFPYTGTGSTTPVGTGTNPPSKPTCDATTQGTLWFTKNASAKDLLELCANGDASGVNFAWRSIAF
jgi:hypothetical protein